MSTVQIPNGLTGDDLIARLNENFRRLRSRRGTGGVTTNTTIISGGGGGGGAVDPWYTITFANPLPIDGASGDKQRVTLTAATVLQDPVNFANGEHFWLRLQQDSTGGRNVTFNDPALWEIPSTFSLPMFASANRTMHFHWIFDGTKMLLGSMPFIT